MLKQNTTINAQYPLRLLGGGVGFMRSMYGRTDRVNQLASEAIMEHRAAVPSGHLAPSAWILPQAAGGMASRNEARAALITQAQALQGVIGSGTAQMILTAMGSGTAIANAQGISSMVMTVSALPMQAILNGAGEAFMALAASGVLNGLGSIAGSSVCALTASMITGARGEMIMAPISQEITPAAIAGAVWGANASSNNASGSMGEKVNDAGSASNPWTEVIESGYTAAEILRLLAAVAAGSATGLDGLTVFKSLDDSKDRVEATVTDTTRTITARDVT